MIQVFLLVFGWWLIIQFFGLAALPITRRVLAWLPDAGYAFGKAFGLLLVSYLLWLGASTGFLINDLGGILLSILFLVAISIIFERSDGLRVGDSLRFFWQNHRVRIIVVEVLFLLSFTGWVMLRAYAPSKIVSAYGEKYMEIAFLNGILRSPQLPPVDPWMSGYAISYYYFGYLMMAVVTNLSGVSPTIGFDLFDALIFSLTVCGAYGVVFNLIAATGASNKQSTVYGFLGAVFVTGMGNLEGLIHGLYSAKWVPVSFLQWLDIPRLLLDFQSGGFYPGHDFYSWWWWRASRVINDLNLSHQPYGMEPITEFPFFSFLLGDNHPHKMALPFVLLAIALSFNVLLKKGPPKSRSYMANEMEPMTVFGWKLTESPAFYVFYALSLGALAFLNTWDFPTYLALVVMAYTIREIMAAQSISWHPIKKGLLFGLALSVLSILLYSFFYIGFSSQAGGILPYIFPPTRLPQYLVMFAPFIVILICFLLLALKTYGSRSPALKTGLRIWATLVGLIYGLYILFLVIVGLLLSQGMLVNGGFTNPLIQKWTGGFTPVELFQNVMLDRLRDPWTFLVVSILIALGLTLIINRVFWTNGISYLSNKVQTPVVFATLIGVLGLGLTLSVEFFYLRDIFGARMNSVFKFYFQGWVLMGCASAYAVWWILNVGCQRIFIRVIFTSVVAVLVTACLVYTVMGIYSRVHGFEFPPNIDASATVAGDYPGHWNSYPDDWAAIQWLNQHAPGVPTILEASEGSYHHAGRISAFTGFPSILGWGDHEYQWRGDFQEQSRRLADIQSIYTSSDPEETLALLDKWKVEFVILGRTERDMIHNSCRQAERICSVGQAEEKFNRLLVLVFKQGEINVYQVPGK